MGVCLVKTPDNDQMLGRAERIFFAKVKQYNKVIKHVGHPTRFVRLDDSHVMIIGWSNGWTHKVFEMESEFTDTFSTLRPAVDIAAKEPK